MKDSTSASVSPPAERLDSRAHTLSGPRTRLQQFAIDLQTALENFIARVSQLPDTPVYASERFAWTQILESNWRLVRTERDQVMQRRDQHAALQQLLDELGRASRRHRVCHYV